MPTYTFKNKVTNEEWTEVLSMAERETFLSNNPDITQLIVSAPSIGDSARIGLVKPDDSFRDVLRSIKKRNPRSTVNTF